MSNRPTPPVIHLTPSELAARWGVTPAHLANLRSRGQGPDYLKPAGRVLYPLAAIEAWEASTTVRRVA